CPSCDDAFVPEIEDDANSIQERPTLKAKSKPSTKGDPDERPRSKKRREDDERPSRKSKKAKSSGNMMLIVVLLLLGGGLIFGMGLLAVGAFVWPGFLVSAPDEKKLANNDPPPNMPRQDMFPKPGGPPGAPPDN